MRKIKLLLSLSFLLFSCAIKAQIIIASQPTKVEFENWYKFNSAIENELNSENQTGQFQAFLDYSIKGEYRKSQELDDMTRQMQPAIPFTAKQVDSIQSNFSAVDAM